MRFEPNLHFQIFWLTADPMHSTQLYVQETKIKNCEYLKRKTKPVKLQSVQFKKFHSQEVWHRLFILIDYRPSILVRALPHTRRIWQQPWLRYFQLWASWGKHKLDHYTSICYQVSTKYTLLVHCKFKSVNRHNV